jgi:hypothetical protein
MRGKTVQLETSIWEDIALLTIIIVCALATTVLLGVGLVFILIILGVNP